MSGIESMEEGRFYTPEEVAPDLGMTKTELRRYARESGHCTRLSKNRITLDRDDARKLIAWVKTRNQPTAEEYEIDPFAA